MEKTKLQSAMTAVSRTGRKQGVLTLASSLVLVGMVGSANATTERDSITSLNKALPHLESTTEGQDANAASVNPHISADGQFTVFQSAATNLAKNNSAIPDIYIHDRKTGKTTLISGDYDDDSTVALQNTGGNLASSNATVSQGGRYVAFESLATNLVKGDTVDAVADVFVHDRETGTTIKVASNATDPVISDDGKYVAFTSANDKLVENDTNASSDVFVYHMISKKTERVSLNNNWQQVKGASSNPSISSGGQYIAFQSTSTELFDKDTNKAADVFLFDRQTGKVELISKSMTGTTGNGASTNPEIGGTNAEWVIFQSDASDLAEFKDENKLTDIFMRDRVRNGTKIVSITADGKAANGASTNPTTSDNGTFVAFESTSTNLATGAVAGSIIKINRWKDTRMVASVDSDGKTPSAGSDPSINNNGTFVAFQSDAVLTTPLDRKMEIAKLVGYHNFSYGDYLYSRVPDANGVTDIYVHHVNEAPIFGPKTLEYCMGEGKQNLHEWDWNHYYDDGDHPGERQNVEYKVTSVDDPKNIFGGIFGQEPTISWPSHSMHFVMQYGTPGTAKVCVTKMDDGLTAHDGKNMSEEKCMHITVKSSCDAGGDELFHANEFDFSHQLKIAGMVPLDTLDFGYSNSRAMKASVSNDSGESVQNVEMHMVVKGADEVIEADPRCEENGSNSEYICRFSELPAGETTLDFQVRSGGSTSIQGGFEASEGPFVEVDTQSAVASESGDASSSSGGGSLGWLTLLGFGLLGRRKLGK